MCRHEAEIEESLIQKLQDLGYVYRQDIKDREMLEKNFKRHFERLNRVSLSDAEFESLLDDIIKSNVFEASQSLRDINTLKRDDDTPLQYTLLDGKNLNKNSFEVVNQLTINTRNSHHRYDVILLINGLPIVQIELKTLNVIPKKAMEQIVRYKNDRDNGYETTLLCFIQLFVISNETNTYYFANNKAKHFSFNADEKFLSVYEAADKENKKITNLYDFANHFLAGCELFDLISKYMVLVASEEKLLIMRPYQIYAVKAIVHCIEENQGNGYIWHTTGSGKTLTSFKAATLLKDNPDIEKCLFVVDRKDLDRQTRLEFNKFQEGCVEENTNTESLVERLESDDYKDKVIVTTIQKLGLALDVDNKRTQNKESSFRGRLQDLSEKRIAIIFDECHRSQFGTHNEAIKTFFPKAQLFGFTGTPIFEENATYKTIAGEVASYKTTKDIFEKELHSYTITNAIDDGNVLRFRVEYFKPESCKQNEWRAVQKHEERKRKIVKAILTRHRASTREREFNAIFATACINDAIEYFHIFKEIQKEEEEQSEDFVPLNIACVFSPPSDGNKDVKQLQEDLSQEREDNTEEPSKKKQALNEIIACYNEMYGTSHTIGEFDAYYQDVQTRIKAQQYSNRDFPHKKKIDIVIVVDMLLTGFDSKYLNTLYVDKNLKYHGLVQAFSRTNRVLNNTKPYGNIIDFWGLEEATDVAVRLFSGKVESEKVKEIWLVESAHDMIEKLEDAVLELENFMKKEKLEVKPCEVSNLKGDEARLKFIKTFKEVQRIHNNLELYTGLKEKDVTRIDELLPKDDLKAWKGAYLNLADKMRVQKESVSGGSTSSAVAEREDVDFEFVLFSSVIVDYEYIMALLAKYSQTQDVQKAEMTKKELLSLIMSTSNLMDEREDIEAYIEELDDKIRKKKKGMSESEIMEGYKRFRDKKNWKELERIACNVGLDVARLKAFVEEVVAQRIFDGEGLSDLLSYLNLGWRERVKKEWELMEDLAPLLKKMVGGGEIRGLSAYEKR